jgi:hypothetical protein
MPDDGEPSSNGQWRSQGPDVSPSADDAFPVSHRTFEDQFDESIVQSLDLNSWRLGNDLDQEYQRMAREVREAEKLETEKDHQIREEFFPRLAECPNMPRHAGLHSTLPEEIAAVHRGLLFNGGVEACHGSVQIHDTLPLTIYQMGISLVSYRGDQGTWGQRLFRRDLRQKGVDVGEWLTFLERRARRDALAQIPGQDQVGEMIQTALLDYAERAILLHRSQALWRMGHGNPVDYQLLTGGGNLEIMVEATRVLRQLVEKHQRFVFLGGEPRERLFMTIGRALRPMEFVVLSTLDARLEHWLHQQRFKHGAPTRLVWDDEPITPAEWIPRVIERVASKIAVGLFRPTLLSPPQLFYAHVDHVDIAGHIALADSMLKEQGTSLLLEMAQRVCTSVFGESLEALAESAYVAAGAHHRFLAGRFHRSR